MGWWWAREDGGNWLRGGVVDFYLTCCSDDAMLRRMMDATKLETLELSNAPPLVSRQTKLGLLVVTLKGEDACATIDGKTVWGGLSKLATPVASPIGPIVARVGGHGGSPAFGLVESEYAALSTEIEAAKAARVAAELAESATPRGERLALATALYNCERGAFPGSKAWQVERDAMRALQAFDDAHPEALAALRAEPREQTGEASLEGQP